VFALASLCFKPVLEKCYSCPAAHWLGHVMMMMMMLMMMTTAEPHIHEHSRRQT
jgi:hypothetical protein